MKKTQQILKKYMQNLKVLTSDNFICSEVELSEKTIYKDLVDLSRKERLQVKLTSVEELSNGEKMEYQKATQELEDFKIEYYYNLGYLNDKYLQKVTAKALSFTSSYESKRQYKISLVLAGISLTLGALGVLFV